jgi:transcriptional regulator GlxA family with amidase domain
LLERRFVHGLGCTPDHEIRRAHMQRANSLLGQTDMPISDVAEASGFGSPEHFARLFHQQTGKTPLRYRREVRRP